MGAVITETIVSDPKIDVRPRIAYNGLGAQNIRLYSDAIEGWEREMEIAKSNGGIVIANVSAHTPFELAYLAVKMENTLTASNGAFYAHGEAWRLPHPILRKSMK